MLGGSGSINGHVCTRGHRSDYDDWAAAGNPGWSYAEVLPYFKRLERRIGPGDNLYRGRDGPFTVTDIEAPDPLCDAFIAAAGSCGIPRAADYNGAEQDGTAYVQRSIHRGRRVSPAGAFLKPALRNGSLAVWHDTHALRLLFDGRRAVGAVCRRDGRELRVGARRGIVLAAGAVGSPHLLQLSGVGDPAQLRALGIEVRAALPGVGQNLQDHYAARFVFRIKGARSINERVRGLPLLAELARYALFRRGALALTPTLVYVFARSDPGLARGDVQLSFTPASYPGGVWSGLDRFPGATIACWQQRPESRGHVRALDPDPLVPPEIQPNYLGTETDRSGPAARHGACAAGGGRAALRGPRRRGSLARPGGRRQERAPRSCPGDGELDLPPHGHLRHGSRCGSRKRGRCRVARCMGSRGCASPIPR